MIVILSSLALHIHQHLYVDQLTIFFSSFASTNFPSSPAFQPHCSLRLISFLLTSASTSVASLSSTSSPQQLLHLSHFSDSSSISTSAAYPSYELLRLVKSSILSSLSIFSRVSLISTWRVSPRTVLRLWLLAVNNTVGSEHRIMAPKSRRRLICSQTTWA